MRICVCTRVGCIVYSVHTVRFSPPNDLAINHSSPVIVYQCSELQGYLRPLLELLNGLKTGRFDKGMTHASVDNITLQPSVVPSVVSKSCYVCTTGLGWVKAPNHHSVTNYSFAWLAGLNTFQQSVAMDRLQRIVGVLQKPHLGYVLHNLYLLDFNLLAVLQSFFVGSTGISTGCQ